MPHKKAPARTAGDDHQLLCSGMPHTRAEFLIFAILQVQQADSAKLAVSAALATFIFNPASETGM